MDMSEDIYAMLLAHDKAKEFTKSDRRRPRDNGGAHRACRRQQGEGERGGRQGDQSGRKGARLPKDYGFMFARSFEDPDGHIWEVFWMDQAHGQKG
ncbi:hypothetical protein DNFV4_00106 [Nitrospira tepida]|uniref:Lactoylglutathione lyase n=2 Tax=Pseudomonadati TaxID=3379134 RepID=A0AA86MVC3_9BACT|nr:hypothetical protein DNFV4_00106 [Nitrospira tepida]